MLPPQKKNQLRLYGTTLPGHLLTWTGGLTQFQDAKGRQVGEKSKNKKELV